MQFERPVLVLAAHPDDEILGAGGLLSQTGGTVQVLCDPYTKGRADEDRYLASQASAALIVSAFASPGSSVAYRHSHLQDEQLRLDSAVDAIEEAMRHVGPGTVVCPWSGDMNQDHRVVAEAAAIATRMSRWPSVRTVLAMEIASSSDQSHGPAFSPTVFVPFMWASKRVMLAAYKHELEYAIDRAPEVLEALARVRGAVVGATHAEGFVLLRGVVRPE